MSVDQQNEFIPTRQSLLERLRKWDDQESWQEFFEIYWKLIYRTALRSGLTSQEAEDVVQETIISVAKHMPTFQYRSSKAGGSFKQWLLTLTKWRINDELRKRVRGVLSTSDASDDLHESQDLLMQIPDPVGNQLDGVWETEWEQNLLDSAIERVKRRTDPKHYQIFYLYAVKKWSAWKVARKLKVSLPQVYTVKHRVSKDIKAVVDQIRKKASHDER
jgi:RNA polymerase sigma factor (sigma-70 family)